MVINIGWRTGFAACAHRCVLSLVLGPGGGVGRAMGSHHPGKPHKCCRGTACVPQSACGGSGQKSSGRFGWCRWDATRAKPHPRCELATLPFGQGVWQHVLNVAPQDNARNVAAAVPPRRCAFCHSWLNISQACRRKLRGFA